MAMTESDLPPDWTDHFGAFVSFGDTMVMGTCRKCYALVNSDSFADHRIWHAELTVRTML
jgi:hypothetical protein